MNTIALGIQKENPHLHRLGLIHFYNECSLSEGQIHGSLNLLSLKALPTGRQRII